MCEWVVSGTGAPPYTQVRYPPGGVMGEYYKVMMMVVSVYVYGSAIN